MKIVDFTLVSIAKLDEEFGFFNLIHYSYPTSYRLQVEDEVCWFENKIDLFKKLVELSKETSRYDYCVEVWLPFKSDYAVLSDYSANLEIHFSLAPLITNRLFFLEQNSQQNFYGYEFQIDGIYTIGVVNKDCSSSYMVGQYFDSCLAIEASDYVIAHLV